MWNIKSKSLFYTFVLSRLLLPHFSSWISDSFKAWRESEYYLFNTVYFHFKGKLNWACYFFLSKTFESPRVKHFQKTCHIVSIIFRIWLSLSCVTWKPAYTWRSIYSQKGTQSPESKVHMTIFPFFCRVNLISFHLLLL